jgi:hypothetical protein
MYAFLPYIASLPLQVDADQILRIVVFVGILIVVWVVLRVVMRIAARLFAIGCAAILILGFFLLLMRLFQQ